MAQVTAGLNSCADVQGKLVIERLYLQPLPVECFAEYEPVVLRTRNVSSS